MRRHKNNGTRCDVPECASEAVTRGWCRLHYRRWQRTGDPTQTHRYEDATCLIDGCAAQPKARGWCARHYRRWQRTGDPTKTSDFFTRTPSERFWGHVHQAQNGCWQWGGHVTRDGYGLFAGALAHRFAWRELRGDIPAGLELDHMCRNRACVNPDHLDPVTPAVNSRRAHLPASEHSALIHQ